MNRQSNPLVRSVQKSLDDLPTHGVPYFFTGGPKDNVLADWGHIQGLAYYRPDPLRPDMPNITVIFSANHYYGAKDWTKPGVLRFYSLYSGNLLYKLELPTTKGTHPGGVQVVGDYLVVPVEAQDKTPESAVYLYDLTLGKESKEPVFTLKRAEKTGGAGLAKFGSGHVLVTYDNGHVTFYRSNGQPLGSPELSFSAHGSVSLDETGHSSVNLVVEANEDNSEGQLYMIGLNRPDTKDLAVLYTVDLSEAEPAVEKVETVHFVTDKTDGIVGDAGVSFRWGAGVYIDPNAHLNLIASARNSSVGVAMTNAFTAESGEVNVLATYKIAKHQKSRVTENFAMTGASEGRVQWAIEEVKPGVDLDAVSFSLMKDKKSANDKHEAKGLKSGSITAANYGGSSHHLYIGELHYEYEGNTLKGKDAIKQLALNGDDESQIPFIAFRSTNV